MPLKSMTEEESMLVDFRVGLMKALACCACGFWRGINYFYGANPVHYMCARCLEATEPPTHFPHCKGQHASQPRQA